MQGFILQAEALWSSQISRKDQRAITYRVVRLEPAWYDLKSTFASNTPSRANVTYDLLLRPLFFLGGGGGGRAKSRGGTYSVHNYLELEANRQVLCPVNGSLPITYNIALWMFYQYEVSIVVTSQKNRE